MQQLSPDSPRVTPPQVVIVEDDEGIRDVLEMLFRDEGYDVVVYPSLETASAALRSRPPHLLVSDLRLGNAPQGGLELVRAAREMSPCPPQMIVLTGMQFSSIPREIAAIKAVGAHVMSKPFDVEALLALAQSLTDWHGTASV
jgi:DNA-binding NtrC family response regulator